MFKDKNQAAKHPADILTKKVGEALPPQSSQMGYGIYHFCECEYSTKVNAYTQTEKRKQIFWNAYVSFTFVLAHCKIKNRF